MIKSFEIIVNILEMSIVIMFLTLYFGSGYKGIKAIGGFLLGAAVCTGAITYLNSLYIYEGILGLIPAVLYFVYCLVFLRGDAPTKLFMSGFINCIVYFWAAFSILLISILGDSSKLFVFSSERIGIIVISKGLLIVSCIILLKFRFNECTEKKNMLLLCLIPVITQLSLVGIMQMFMRDNELNHELLLNLVSVMLVNVLIYYIFVKINKNAQTKLEMFIMRQQIENEEKTAQDMEELYNKIYGMKHDLAQHFYAIYQLIIEDKDKALAYIQNILQEKLEIRPAIKTNNDCFNAIVNSKITICENYGIHTKVKVDNNAINKFPYNEIVILFGNLFDNAIEASKNSDKKMIKLEAIIQDQYVAINMKNSINKSVLGNNKELRTTKQDKQYHGFGVKNIKRIVGKYKGQICYLEENGYFVCDIMILKDNIH